MYVFHHNIFESADDRDPIDNNSCYKLGDISQKFVIFRDSW